MIEVDSIIEKMTSPDVSIVTCSIDEDRFGSFQKNIIDIFGKSAEIIRICGANSMAEGYNRGARKAKADIIVFCHEDIEFLNADVPNIIKADLSISEIVGVAGTSRLSEGRWHTAGKAFIHGQVAHSCNFDDHKYQLCLYGYPPYRPVVNNIQALDGLFFAIRRDVLIDTYFDEAFDGFHLYDLDFTFSAYLMGLRISIDYRIHVLHHSGGQYDMIWMNYFDQFNRKYKRILTENVKSDFHDIQCLPFNSKESVKSKMKLLHSGVE